jgi:hypothetical protein
VARAKSLICLDVGVALPFGFREHFEKKAPAVNFGESYHQRRVVVAVLCCGCSFLFGGGFFSRLGVVNGAGLDVRISYLGCCALGVATHAGSRSERLRLKAAAALLPSVAHEALEAPSYSAASPSGSSSLAGLES